jgi:large subunit ribosomal protein L18
VYRSSKHIYAQVVHRGQVLATASTLEKTFGDDQTGNVEASKKIGALVGARALEKGVKQVAFDRSGYRYHGRVKAVAEAAREAGLKI